jgi:hypothetical protein
MSRSIGCLLVAVVAFGCRDASKPQPHSSDGPRPKVSVAVVGVVDIGPERARIVLQKVLDATQGDVSLAVCDASLERPLHIVTTEPKPFAVVMAMMVTQLGAPLTVEGTKWTSLCTAADGSGTLFTRGQPPTSVLVPKAPEQAGS